MTNHLFYGLATAVVSFVFTLVMYFLGFHGENFEQGQTFGYFGLVIMIVGLVLSMLATRTDVLEIPKDYSYVRAVGAGLMTSIFIGIFSGILGFIYISYINPDMVEYVVAFQQEMAMEKGAPEEALNQIEQGTRMFMNPLFYSLFTLVSSVFFGILFSVIIAIFVKRKQEDQPVVAA